MHKGFGESKKVNGLAIATKQCILFGSEGNTKIFTSKFVPGTSIERTWKKNNLPKVVVETVDPIALGCKIKRCRRGGNNANVETNIEVNNEVNVVGVGNTVEIVNNIPTEILGIYDGTLSLQQNNDRCIFVTLGLFSIVKIIRSVQALIPSYDLAPLRPCDVGGTDEPCSLFSRIEFPMNEFNPPASDNFPKYEAYPTSTLDERIRTYPAASKPCKPCMDDKIKKWK